MPLSKFELKTKRSFGITSYLLLTIKYYKMKKKNFIYGLVMATVLFTACTDDADDSNNFANLQADIETITDNLTDGSWSITNFIDSGQNETGNFTGYGFSFNSDGSLVADNGSVTETGTWSLSIDDDSNDDN